MLKKGDFQVRERGFRVDKDSTQEIIPANGVPGQR